jgi:hypothetical protein
MPIFASRAGVIVTLYRGPRENRTVTAKEATQLAGRPPPAYTRMTLSFSILRRVYGRAATGG